MSVREKRAWISLVATLLVSALYRLQVPLVLRSAAMLHALVICIAAPAPSRS